MRKRLTLLMACLCALTLSAALASGGEPLAPGASGERVAALLEKLADLGYLSLPVSADHSLYAEKYLQAVISAEQALGLTADGTVTAEEMAVILDKEADAPGQPAAFAAEGDTKGVTLTWKGAKGVIFYRIYRLDISAEEPLAVVSGKAVKWRDDSAPGDADYTYQLEPCKYTVSAPRLTCVCSANPYRRVGEVVTFGRYVQGEELRSGKTPIEWLVLEVKGDRALLISRYAIDCRPYHYKSAEVTWQTCSLRSWLNNDFLQAAFVPEERAAILTATVDNSRAQGYPGWTATGGNDTGDQIYLLSYAEVERYFPTEAEMRCKPTAHAVSLGATVDRRGNCWWWLRSPGDYQYRAARVTDSGTCFYSLVEREHVAVRPVMWIDLRNELFQ